MWRDVVSVLCDQRGFYGPRQRWMGVSGILRAGVWMNGWRAYQSGFWGNVRGEGFVLGAVYVIGPGQQVSELMRLTPSHEANDHRDGIPHQ